MAFLRRQHPAKTAEEIEAATGGAVSAGTAKKWLAMTSAPSFRAVVALIAAYGPALLAAAFERCPAWLSAAQRDLEHAALIEEQRRLDLALGALRERAA